MRNRKKTSQKSLVLASQRTSNSVQKVRSRLDTGAKKRGNSSVTAWLSYSATRPSLQRPYAFEWPRDAHLDIDQTTRRVLVAKSRELERDNAYWSKFLDIHENYTVGRGIPVTPASSDSEFNEFMKNEWRAWAEHPFIDNDLSLAEGMRVIARATACDGEIFVLKVGNANSQKLQIVETQRVATPTINGRDLQSIGNIIDGIRVNGYGEKISYFVRSGLSDKYVEIPACQVEHVYNPGRVGQLRGIPLCTNVINDLIDLSMLHSMEMDAAKFNSRVSAIWKRQGDGLEEMDNPFADSSASTVTLAERQTQIEKVVQGNVIGLNPGDELTPFASDRPTTVTMEYWELLLKKISAGIGYSDLLIFPRNCQGTVVRANLETTSARLRMEHEIYAAAIRNIYRWFAGFRSWKTTAADYWMCRTEPPRSCCVDIERNSQALIQEVRNGMRSLTSVVSELGVNLEDHLEEKAREYKIAEKLSEKYKIPLMDLLSSGTWLFGGNMPSEAFGNISENKKEEGKNEEGFNQ